MYRTFVGDLREHIGQTVTVRGWVNARRLQRAMQFVILRDPTGLVQVTHKRTGDGLERDIESLTDHSAVAVTGRVVDNPVVKLGGLEIVPERVEVLGLAQAPLPVNEHSGGEHRLDWRYLDIRLRRPPGWCSTWPAPSSRPCASSPTPRVLPRCTRPS